jgi:Immunity protein 7
MHEFYAWISLHESPFEDEGDILPGVIKELEARLREARWPSARFSLDLLNGSYVLTAAGVINRRRTEGEFLDSLVDFIADKLPGSFGLVYDRDAAMPDPPGPNAFRVRVVARGRVVDKVDTYLSPYQPVIEDCLTRTSPGICDGVR